MDNKIIGIIMIVIGLFVLSVVVPLLKKQPSLKDSFSEMKKECGQGCGKIKEGVGLIKKGIKEELGNQKLNKN